MGLAGEAEASRHGDDPLGESGGGPFEDEEELVSPAGVAHRNLGSKDGFAVVGAYPDGIEPDLKEEGAGETGKEPERIVTLARPVLLARQSDVDAELPSALRDVRRLPTRRIDVGFRLIARESV